VLLTDLPRPHCYSRSQSHLSQRWAWGQSSQESDRCPSSSIMCISYPRDWYDKPPINPCTCN
jgi:hypothetical protein